MIVPDLHCAFIVDIDFVDLQNYSLILSIYKGGGYSAEQQSLLFNA